MRILHTADWHLGKRLGPFSRLEEQRDFLQELVELCRSHRVDMVVVAGDVFDVPNPSSEAVELLYRSLKILAEDGNRPVVVIGGNHDSAERIDAPDPLARENGIFFYGSPLAQPGDCNLACGLRVRHPEPGFARFSHPAWDREVALIVAPFANEHRLKLSLPVEEGTSPFAQEDRNTREMPQPDGTPAAPENQPQPALESGSTPNTGSQPRLDAGSE
ncbi:metallophosphoesterase family protein, partial [Spirochaeta lutea]|uniref:metallophosphoesterase family protein n=1 Tax=Spirochaeta lutea TaxID=1480694 RepID=UPI0012E08161